MSSPPVTDPSRRRFLKSMAAAALCPVFAGCEFVDLKDAGPTAPTVPFSLDDPDFARLADIGGSACVQTGPFDILLVRATDEEIIAVERMCPHQDLPLTGTPTTCGAGGPPLRWDAAAQQITCPWHDSVFARDGSRISGEAPRGLLSFPVRFDPEAGEGELVLPGGPPGGGPPGDETSEHADGGDAQGDSGDAEGDAS